MTLLKGIDFFEIESAVWVAEKKTGLQAYDFSFYPLFHQARSKGAEPVTAIARLGAIADYDDIYKACSDAGFVLANDTRQHRRAAKLSEWYPLLRDLTPVSKVYRHFPDNEAILKDFSFPVFIKGDRQTSKHRPELSIARNEEELEYIRVAYRDDAILHWQDIVCREYVPLRPVGQASSEKMPLSYEFRTFWWKGHLAGSGHYWSQYLHYTWLDEEKEAALQVAKEASRRLDVPFLVVDMALTAAGNWIVIECNDAQESGYCGADRAAIWQNIINLERKK